MSKLVQGIGVNAREYPTKVGGKNTEEYDLWHHMLFRCTKKELDRNQSYNGTTCSEGFKNYSFFYKWCNSQIGFGNKDEKGKSWQLDKDILIQGDKVYSEDVCVFVPHRANNLLIKSDAIRGDLLVGVTWHKQHEKFMAKCKAGSGKQQYLGYFNTAEEAFHAYKVFKENLIKQVANEYKEQLDPRAYQALLNYTVEITD